MPAVAPLEPASLLAPPPPSGGRLPWRQRALRRLVEALWPAQRWQQALDFIARQQHLDATAFADAALDFLQTRYLVDQVEADRIPTHGPALVIANHPLGAVDALVMISLLGRVRRDLRFMANQELALLQPLKTQMFAVDVMGARGGADVLRAAAAALDAGQMVLLFPSGEVARWRLAGIVESPWQNGFARLAERSGAPVIPVHLKARNSALFYALGALSSRLATASLAREALHAPARRIEVRVGPALPSRAAGETARRDWVRACRSTLLRLPRQVPGAVPAAVARPMREREWLLELRVAPCLQVFADSHEVRLCRLHRGSALLDELGRLRELSFRAAGEGSGQRRDIDRFDPAYEHLVLFDPLKLAIVGAYRLGRCAALLAAPDGERNLYTSTLFRWDARLSALLPQALELGRSFVAPDCQGTRCLDQLWIGIGAYLRLHPELRYLFGPVSLSAALPVEARARLTEFYQHFHGCAEGWAQAVNPAPSPRGGTFGELDVGTAFLRLKEELRRMGVTVPTLYRQYTELTEPGGVRFLAFGSDPDFADCVDGLMLLDLARIKAGKRQRYLEAAPRPSRARAPSTDIGLSATS